MLQTAGRPEVIAAAVCWVIDKGNERFGQELGELRVKDLMGYFGLGQSSMSGHRPDGVTIGRYTSAPALTGSDGDPARSRVTA